MITKFTKNDEVYEIVTKQYTIGLYVCVYIDGNVSDQDSLNLKEIVYHKKLRKKLTKNNITFTGTLIE